MKVAYFDQNGKLQYVVETSGKIETNPPFVVDVTDVTTPFNAIDQDGNLIWVEPQKTLDEVKQEKLDEIKNTFQGVIDRIKSEYAPYEIESFADQRAEWRAWVQDPQNAKTPIVDALAAARGIDREALLQKVGEKALQIVSLQGLQNRLEDIVNAATSITEVEAVDPNSEIKTIAPM